MRASVALVLLVSSASAAIVAACTDQVNPTSPEPGAVGNVDSGGGGGDAQRPEDSAVIVDSGANDAGADAGADRGSGTIAGSVGGTVITGAMNAYWIGMPDDATTTAVYLIGGSVACDDLTVSGWAHTIPAGIKVFEMILKTASPAAISYTVSAGTPPVGGAEVQFIVAEPARNETRATSGSVLLKTITSNTAAVGSFHVQFPASVGSDASADTLDGTFNAVYCAAGHEP